MKAIVLTKSGGPEILVPIEVPDQKPKKGEVCVRIEYAGINYAEILSRKGLYGWAVKRPYVLGMEASGIIEEVSEGVSDLSLGQKVMVGTKSGTYAEKIVVSQGRVTPAIEAYSMEENASFLVNYMTAWVSLLRMAKIEPNEKILITASAGGVGTAAVQIASKIGCEVYGMAGSQEKVELVKELGAVKAYNYRNPDCFKELIEDTGGVDVVLEMVGGQVYKKSLDTLNPFGRIVVAGFASLNLNKLNPISWVRTWQDIPRVNVGDLAKKSISVMSSHLGYLLEQEPEEMKNIFNDLREFVEEHNIRPVVGKVFPFEETSQAHRYIENRQSVGKVLLKISS